MIKKISYLIYKFLWVIDLILNKFTRRKLLIWFSEFIEQDSYKEKTILEKKIKFFTPNYISNFLIDEFFTKEKETIEWIDGFEKNKNMIFWDIGANIGIYSIYAALKHQHIQVVSFEPSTSNLRILSRNISINNLDEKIFINQFPLSNVENKYLTFKEEKFMEGVASHTWGENLDFEGKKFNSTNNYKIYGTSINYLLENKILQIPDYIKLDVDGIEHLILEGASKFLSNPKIKSLSIEINENFNKQLTSVMSIMEKSNFIYKYKKRSENYIGYKDIKLSKTYNYVFEK